MSSAKKSSKSKLRLAKNSDGDALTDEDLLQLVPGGLAHAFVVSKMHDKQLAIAGLGPEPDWEGEMPELPSDIATEDHDTLSNLLAAFTNAYSTATWYASMSLIEAGHYDDIVEFLKATVMKEAQGSSKEKRDAEVITDGRVVAAKALARTAHSDYIRFRDTASRLKAKGAAVSRIGGFVGDEADAENLRANKSSTRGRSLGSGRGSSRGNAKKNARR
jgi:hypothetical protein